MKKMVSLYFENAFQANSGNARLGYLAKVAFRITSGTAFKAAEMGHFSFASWAYF